MGKYDKYRKAIQEELAFNEDQARLHDKYKDIEDEVVIKETTNMIKFLAMLITRVSKTLFGIALILLAAAGLIALLYPDVRLELMSVLAGIKNEIIKLI